MNGTDCRRLVSVCLLLTAGTAFAPCDAGSYDRAASISFQTGLSYVIPEITLVDQGGRRVSLSSQLDIDRPVVLDFVFTSCTTVCPISTARLSKLQAQLTRQRAKFRPISISIDPEHGTPEALRQYAQEFGAGPDWRFLTGDAASVLAVQKAFDAYRGGKTYHPALTFMRFPHDPRWLRFEGLVSADTLLHHFLTLAPDNVAAK